MFRKLFNQIKLTTIHLKPSKVKKVFFVLSTGRCGTRYLCKILNLANNAIIMHEPPPGCESINPMAYEIFLKDKAQFNQIRVSDFDLLAKHAIIYKSYEAECFGDCYNSLYPFAIALYYFFNSLNIDVKFIHLIRNPIECCSSILRAEGPYGENIRKNFRLRSPLLLNSNNSAEKASNIWIKINEVIDYQIQYIERLKPNSTRLIRIEDMKETTNIQDLYQWLELSWNNKGDLLISTMDNTSYDVKHSHQQKCNEMGIPEITEEELTIIKNTTQPFASKYGYE